MSERLTTSQRWEEVNAVPVGDHVNKVAACDSVNTRQPLPAVNLSEQQRRILELAAQPRGVSSHEAVIAIGGDRIRARAHYMPSTDVVARLEIVGTKAARSVAASVSRTISRLYKLGLLEQRQHPPRRLPDGRTIEGPSYRYHATERED